MCQIPKHIFFASIGIAVDTYIDSYICSYQHQWHGNWLHGTFPLPRTGGNFTLFIAQREAVDVAEKRGLYNQWENTTEAPVSQGARRSPSSNTALYPFCSKHDKSLNFKTENDPLLQHCSWSPVSTETFWYGALWHCSSAVWSVCGSQHHTTVFGSVLTRAMSWISSARLESAQSLRFTQCLPVGHSDKNGHWSHIQLSVITNSRQRYKSRGRGGATGLLKTSSSRIPCKQPHTDKMGMRLDF